MAEEHKEQGVSGSEGEVKDRGLFDFLGKKGAEEKKPDEGDYLAAGVQNIHIEEGHKAHEGKVKEEEKQHEKEEKEGEKHPGLLGKFHRSHSSSSSSSSSDEEEEVVGEGGIKEKIKKKKKKSLKEKISGKAQGGEVHHEGEKEHHEEEKKHHEEEKRHHEEEKKHHEERKEHHEERKEPVFVPPQPVDEPKVRVEEVVLHEPAAPEEEKKGFLDKIKEKLPGHSKKPAEEGAHAPHPDTVEATGEHVKAQETAEGPEGKEKKGFLGKIVDKLSGHHKSAGEEGDKSPASH